MADALKPAYLFSGGDGAKLDRALARLRERAERGGGAGALESFSATGSGGPDVDAVAAAIPAMSLMTEDRYLLVDGVERWRAPQVKVLGEAMGVLPPQTVVVLVARGKAPTGLAELVKKSGGEAIAFEAPRRKELPAWVVASARERGLALIPRAAKLLVDRVGESTVRLAGELDKLALWASASPGPGSGAEPTPVGVEDVEALTIDSSERAGWTLGDAIVSRDVATAVAAADGLLAQGEAVTPLVYGMASRLRNAHTAAAALEAGTPPREVEGALPMAPYPAKMLVRSVRGTEAVELSTALAAVAELEWWSRGGSNYDDRTALTLAVRKAAGAR